MTSCGAGHFVRTFVSCAGALALGTGFLLGTHGGPGSVAGAACNGGPSDDIPFPTPISPVPNGFMVEGPAPLKVVIAINESAILSPPVTSSLDWGDGSGNTTVTIVACGDDVYSFPAQQHAHTYMSPGVYPVIWNLVAQGAPQIAPAIAFVTVHAALPTPAPPEPTATSPAPVTQSPATPTTVATSPSPAAPTSPPVTETAASVPAAPAVTRTGTATATVTAVRATETPTSTPSPTRTPAAVAVAVATEEPPHFVPSGRPELVRSVPDITEVSTDGDVLATNLALAGITIWVFFSSVLFNQTMAQHRDEMTGWFAWLPDRKRLPKLPATSGIVERVALPVLVLSGMGILYGLLEPGFGLNEASVVLFLSVTIGVGVVGFFYSSVEAWARRTSLGSVASVRTFPLALLVAAASVALSKLLDLHPGVVYGFAASCVVLGTATEKAGEGRALVAPVTACLALSVLCWLLLAPARSFPVDGVAHVLEGIAVIIFIGGLEGLLVNLLPLDVMDGAKIYRWSRRAWFALLLLCAFLFWHVLLNSQRQYFDSLREASSAAVLVAFLLYTLAGAGLWAWFKWGGRPGGKTLAAEVTPVE
jgi:hypothetical protein